ncbi:uncharacterized protein A1O5_00064 [Cladophialophora psammophila CBS 110553]|uniref:Zn(2)-C6 fungal-type domain-containing protein n=1 Tax=Cladophialophora psammophila CBS 110553 TaxID=1182543 RepID=W9X5R1_9EURO|nr:uncharacterized protein A1O5_00064 [Cladophialophora psammophila CBS 110553]EXJ75558.1 hypothetical protein A1O5_00064 [Cladophialophora psammophila CBS 110553]
MPNRKESQDVKPSPKPGSGEPARSRVRIGRACDRCKIKKSKCDGNTPCSACIAAESTCEYSARRRREARDWYLGMQDVIDEALQRLYWACREGRGFPGVIPDESGGRVSTDAILQGLGLNPPRLDNTSTRPAGDRVDSASDTQAQPHRPQSYRPPDFQPPNLLRTKTTSSVMTPGSTASDDRLTFVEAVTASAGQRAKRTSVMEVDGEEEDMSDGLPDGLPDSLGQQFHERMDGSVDPAVLQDEHVGLMDGSIYPDTGVMDFDSGRQPSTQGWRRGKQAAGGQFEVDGLAHERYGSEQQAWEGQDQGVDGMLPWPGNMAFMQRRPRHDDSRSGFDDLVGEW